MTKYNKFKHNEKVFFINIYDNMKQRGYYE